MIFRGYINFSFGRFIQILLLVGICAIPAFACGPFAPGDEEAFGGTEPLTLFTWRMAPDSPYATLFAREDGWSYPFDRNEDEDKLVLDAHAREWAAFFGLKDAAGFEIAHKLISAKEPLTVWSAEVLPLLSKGSPLQKSLAQAPTRNQIESYLTFMKQAETAVGGGDWADEKTAKTLDWVKNQAVAVSGRKDIPEFIRERWAFQLVRASSFADNPGEAWLAYVTFFLNSRASGDKALQGKHDPVNDSLVAWRALMTVARSVEAQGEAKHAFADYISVMEHAPVLARSCISSLLRIVPDDKTWDEWTASLTTVKQRNIARMAHALIDPHRDQSIYIEAILTEDPASIEATLLLIRTMRAVEYEKLKPLLSSIVRGENLGTSAFTSRGYLAAVPRTEIDMEDPDSEPLVFTVDRLAALQKFTDTWRKNNKVASRAIWMLAYERFLTLSGKTGDAKGVLAEANSLAGLSAREKSAIHLEETILGLATGIGESDLQKRIDTDANWLSWIAGTGAFTEKPETASVSTSQMPNAATISRLAFANSGSTLLNDNRPANTFWSLLGQHWLERDEIPLALLAFSASKFDSTLRFLTDMYSTESDIANMEKLLQSPASGWQTELAAHFLFTYDELHSLRGIKLLRTGDWNAAATIFVDLPSNYGVDTADKSGTELPYNILKVCTSDINLEFEPEYTHMSRLELARQLAGLEARAHSAGPSSHVASAALARMAWLFQSSPYIGYAEFIWQGWLSYNIRFFKLNAWPLVSDKVKARASVRLDQFRDEYDNKYRAARLLDHARQLAGSDEIQATWALGSLINLDQAGDFGEWYQVERVPGIETMRQFNIKLAHMNFAWRFGRTETSVNYSRQCGGYCSGIDDYRFGD